MKVVFDTNIIFFDAYLEHNRIKRLCEACKKKGYSIYIPAVVFDEHISHYRDRLISKKTSKDSYEGSQAGECNIDWEMYEYQRKLENRLYELDIQKIHYFPSFPGKMVERITLNKKPFRQQGGKHKSETGYRDALIWETILWMCDKQGSDNPQVVFISNNSKDFCERRKSRELHKDLKSDLISRGYGAIVR